MYRLAMATGRLLAFQALPSNKILFRCDEASRARSIIKNCGPHCGEARDVSPLEAALTRPVKWFCHGTCFRLPNLWVQQNDPLRKPAVLKAADHKCGLFRFAGTHARGRLRGQSGRQDDNQFEIRSLTLGEQESVAGLSGKRPGDRD